jgi:hypothetical protein
MHVHIGRESFAGTKAKLTNASVPLNKITYYLQIISLLRWVTVVPRTSHYCGLTTVACKTTDSVVTHPSNTPSVSNYVHIFN